MNRAAWLGLAFLVLVAACGTTTPARLGQYLGPDSAGTDGPGAPAGLALPQPPIRAALVLIADTTAPEAAPPPPEEALNRLAESLQQQISGGLPIVIEKILPADGIRPGVGPEPLQELGRKHGVDYVLPVVVSATEQEYPLTIFLGWTSHSQPGWRRDNWSLLEVALLDVKSGRTLLRAEGRGSATLDRPAAPGINQWYPVVWLRPADPVRRFWPPTYAGAPNTLRVVAINEAAKRLVLNLQDAWIQKRQIELDSARS